MPIYFTGGSFNGGTITNPLVITQGTITADAPQVDGTVTWNNAGIVGPAWKLNVTATSANAAALLMDLQVGGTSVLKVSRVGVISVATGGFTSTATPSFGNWSLSGEVRAALGVSTPGYFSLGTAGAADVFLNRDAANIYARRNGTTAQSDRLYNTYTSLTNRENFAIDWITAANVCQIGVEKGSGGGTARQADWMSPDGIVALRFQMGFGTGRAPNIGTAYVNTTAVGNVDAGEDDLMSYPLPLASFIAATKRVHITAWGNTANNANAKTLKLYFGSVILTNALTISIAGIWRIEADVVSTGTDAQDYVAQLVTTGTAGVALNDIEQGALTEDDGAAITIKCTGEAVATNDIIQQGMIIAFGN